MATEEQKAELKGLYRQYREQYDANKGASLYWPFYSRMKDMGVDPREAIGWLADA